ncbi:unnamed protein product [Rangifer tarandus platyrhynchus]|uniref:Uncharacterized protein n=1 Tax=Rangifer tarandus platyrhynchus TaxID=3082113 RepID=A0AC59YBV0_RANTA
MQVLVKNTQWESPRRRKVKTVKSRPAELVKPPGGVLPPPDTRGLLGRSARRSRETRDTHGNRRQRPSGHRTEDGGRQGAAVGSSPTQALSHPAAPEPLPSAAAQAPNRPAEPALLPATPNRAPSAPTLTVTRAPHHRQARGHLLDPQAPTALLSRQPPLYLGRAAARSLLQQLRLGARLSRGVADNHPVSAPSTGQSDQSARDPKAGTESRERKARLRRDAPRAAFCSVRTRGDRPACALSREPGFLSSLLALRSAL